MDAVRYAAPFAVFLVFFGLLRRQAARAGKRGQMAVPFAEAPLGSRFSATHVRFFAAWAIGVASMLLSGVDGSFGAPLVLAGGLLMWAGVALARDPQEWSRFRAAAARNARFAGAGLPAGTAARWSFAGAMCIIGAAWASAGVLAAARLVGA